MRYQGDKSMLTMFLELWSGLVAGLMYQPTASVFIEWRMRLIISFLTNWTFDVVESHLLGNILTKFIITLN